MRFIHKHINPEHPESAIIYIILYLLNIHRDAAQSSLNIIKYIIIIPVTYATDVCVRNTVSYLYCSSTIGDGDILDGIRNVSLQFIVFPREVIERVRTKT